MAKIKCLITEIENADPRPFGPSATLHYSIILRTDNNEELTAMLSENVLRRSGLAEDDLDDIVGCHIAIDDQYDRDGVMTATAEERVEQVLDGTYRLLFLSSANAKLIKSDVFIADRKKLRADTKAEQKIREEERRLMQKKADALNRLIARNSRTETPEKTEEKTPEKTESEPNLETNTDDAPF